MTRSGLGFVVIGRNEGMRLVRCLQSLPFGLAPIVYVDSGSTDASVDRAWQMGAFVVSLDISSPFTAARARNAGFLALKSLNPDLSFVQFIDGDCEISPGWIDSALDHIERDQHIAVVCGRRRERC